MRLPESPDFIKTPITAALIRRSVIRYLAPSVLKEEATCGDFVTKDTYCSKRAARSLDGGQRCSDKSSSQLQIFHLAREELKSAGEYVGGEK